MPSRPEYEAPARSQLQREGRCTASESTKPDPAYVPILQRAFPRVAILLTCAIYLASSFAAVYVGFHGIANTIYPRHKQAVDEYLVLSTSKYTEDALYKNLDTLLSSQLNRGFMETHEDCLVRGLKEANYELYGLGFQYPDMRTQVMDWTMENCGRLQYTPQVVIQDPTPQQAVLTYWADASYRSRRMLEGALGAVQQQARRFLKLLSSAFTNRKPSPLTEHVPVSANTGGTLPPSRALPKVPFGFALRCEPTEPCRLVYPPGSSKRTNKVSVSREVLAKLKREIKEMRDASRQVKKAKWATEQVVIFFDYIHASILVVMFAIIFGVAPFVIPKAVRPPPPSRKTEQIKIMPASLHFCFVGRLISELLFSYPIQLPYGARWATPFQLYFLFVGNTMLLQFFIISGPRFENINLVYKQIKELYFIARGWEVPDGAMDSMLTWYGIHIQPADPKPKPTEVPGGTMDNILAWNGIRFEAVDSKFKLPEVPSGVIDKMFYQCGIQFQYADPKPKPTEEPATVTVTTSSPSDNRPQHAQSHPSHQGLAAPSSSPQEGPEAHFKKVQEGAEVHFKKVQEASKSQPAEYIDVPYIGSLVDTDSETESEDEHGSFVDLACGVTPQVSDVESGWSIVDA
ncbi:uncharacterized protein J4E84_004989 [Alternaria hordeiaustralica]|uniref:uncharacterized protein n=1 Tax=Alternaria hordeiaustralica TaxID=1187925 RepID=UPI0020C4164C|nr:uncharacterized protein J4E84_004989 [Alternaria hordeiaustralica]KAI4688061.1 hypothetical protein J4E84_004989 [Alternaria hordeiaustralica]